MTPAAIPANEADRLTALYRYRIIDTAAEAAFDDFTQLAAQICETPIAVISLVDETRQWSKSQVGIDAPQTPRDISFCGHAIHANKVFEVANTLDDERFFDNPAVSGEAGIRFYAGAPLLTPQGEAIGTLCVLDKVPRQLSQPQKTALVTLARQVLRQMDLRLLIIRERELNLVLSTQARFQQVLLNSAMATVISLNGQGLITSFNPAGERLLGYSAGELIGKQAIGFLHVEEELQARARELGAELGRDVRAQESLLIRARRGGPETREWHYRRKDGSRVPVMVSVAALSDDDGAMGGFVVLAWDITERRRSRDEIVRLNADLERRVSARTAELERTASDLQMLSQSLAHDLRQPLIAMSGYSSLLQQEVVSERGQHCLARISAGISQINVRADALLYFANLSHAPLQRTSVDLGKLALAYIDALQSSEPHRRVTSTVQPELVTSGDPALLAQVMQELLKNAWRFTASRPLTRLEVGSQTRDDGDTVFYVRDNGEGFDMTHAGGLFDPFQSLHPMPDASGDGLGLARVKRILMKHDGQVWAESKVGSGSTFYFTLSPA